MTEEQYSEQPYKGSPLQAFDKLRKENKELQDQLTKAKEIIRTFLDMPLPNNEEVFADVGAFLSKAEAFLKEQGK